MTTDTVTQWALLAAGLAAAMVFVARHRLFFGLSAAGLLFLGADEGLDIHEKLGEWTEQHARTWLVQDADAAVLGAWGLLMAVLTVVRWRDLAEVRVAAWAWIAGATFSAAAVAMDGFVPHEVRGAHGEEFLEAGGAIAIATAYVLHALNVVVADSPRVADPAGSRVEP